MLSEPPPSTSSVPAKLDSLRTLPVGRYWYVSVKRSWEDFQQWLQGSPWVTVEKVEQSDEWRFYIFKVEAPHLAKWTNPGFAYHCPQWVQSLNDTIELSP